MEVRKNTAKRRKEYELVQAAQKGEQAAFARLFEMYFNTIYYMILKMVKDPFEAEDLAIDSFTRAFNNIQFYIPTNAFITWLSRIAVNRTIDFLRKQKSKNQTVSIDEPHMNDSQDSETTLKGIIEADEIDPEEDFIKRETSELLYSFLQRLPEDYRDIMIMRYFDQLSYKEIAEKMQLPLGTIKARLYRGKELLRVMLRNKKSYFK